MARRPSSDQLLKKVLGASDQSLRKHSSLYDWMLENHSALKAEFERNGPQWPVRVQAMADAGLTDRTGKPASLRVTRNTWYSVCRAVEGRKPEADKPSPVATTVLVPAQRTAKPAPPASHPSDDDEDEIEWTAGDGTIHRTRIPKQK